MIEGVAFVIEFTAKGGGVARVMDQAAHAGGGGKAACNSYSTQGIEAVGILQQSRFAQGRCFTSGPSVLLDAGGDHFDPGGICPHRQ